MSIPSKKLRPKDIANSAAILSPIEKLTPLPAPYDTGEHEPDFQAPKEDWATSHCLSLDGFIVLDGLKRPQTKEEEDEFVRRFIGGLAKSFTDANNSFLQPLRLTIDNCAKCNTCSDACHIFKASGGHELYRPLFRVEVLRRIFRRHFSPSGKLLGGFVGADVEVNWESIVRLGELAYRCNLCRRCAQTCPLGLDNGMVAREIRKIFSQELGIAPSPIHAKGSMKQLEVGATTGLTRPALLDTLEFIEEDIFETCGREIHFPIDKEGADILLIHNSGEFLAWPENPAAFAILLDEAGVSWTLSSAAMGYDSVNYGIWYDDAQAKKIALKQFAAARELGVNRIVIGECGHAHKAAAISADRMAAGKDRVPVESFLPVLHELVKSGKLIFDPSKNDFPVTLHDPCNIVRQMGIVKPQRDILKAICPQFREMDTCGVNNYCCGGGSGFAIMNSYNFGDFRNKVSGRTKFAQIIKAFGSDFAKPEIIKYVCAPCSNCKGTMRELFEFFEATERYHVHYGGLVELMVNALASMEQPYLTFEPQL
jgi:Fe-S oxidoreductase